MDPNSSLPDDQASFTDNLAASQIETPPSLPGQTPPSTVTEPLFSSSIAGGIGGTSQMDIPGTIRYVGTSRYFDNNL